MSKTTDIYAPYLEAECGFDGALLSSSVPNSLVVGQFGFENPYPLPIFLKTGLYGMGVADRLKYISGVKLYGYGRVWSRCIVDNELIAKTPNQYPLVLTEDPYKSRIFSLPRGTCGYNVDFEFVVMGRLVFADIIWDFVSEEA